MQAKSEGSGKILSNLVKAEAQDLIEILRENIANLAKLQYC